MATDKLVYCPMLSGSATMIIAALLGLNAAGFAQADVKASPSVVDISSLLKLETDLSTLPDLEDWTSSLQSSYDRSGGNADFGNYLSQDGTEGVMADMDGPGSIVRIWSALPSGTIKIYIDGSAAPIIEGPFSALFDGSLPPFTAPLATTSSGGYYSYLPIPYSHHCRVVLDGSKDVYYHVNYLTFPAGTRVRSFSLPLSENDRSAVSAAGQVWSALAAPEANATSPKPARTVAQGSAVVLGIYRGPGVVKEISLSLPNADDLDLRKVVLRCYFDGHSVPDIAAPVGDFFGNAFGRRPFHTLPLGCTADGTGIADFPMPFGHSARFTLENGTAKPLTVLWGANLAHAAFAPKRTGYFHAIWSQETTTSGKPHVWAQISGQRGKFVGVVQTMQSAGGITYLEGDDQFRVDGQSWMPSRVKGTVIGPWNGTGTEDFFNSGWYFQTGYNSLPMNALLLKNADTGSIDCVRWLFDDAPIFQSSLDAQIEHGETNSSPGVIYSSVAYWYSNGPVQPWAAMPPASQIPAFAQSNFGFVVPGAYEGENLLGTARVSGGQITGQDMSVFHGEWSSGGQLFWQNGKVGDTLSLTVTTATAGQYDVIGYFTKAPDYGRAVIQVDGKLLSRPFDGYSPTVENSGPIDLGTVTLPAGSSNFVVTLTGKNDASINTFFGLDCLTLKQTNHVIDKRSNR